MGQLADALRYHLHHLAQSDARSLRAINQELQVAVSPEGHGPSALASSKQQLALLGPGSFQRQTVQSLWQICKANGIKGVSKLKKAELCKTLEREGIQAPPPPLESFSKKELIAMLKTLLQLP